MTDENTSITSLSSSEDEGEFKTPARAVVSTPRKRQRDSESPSDLPPSKIRDASGQKEPKEKEEQVENVSLVSVSHEDEEEEGWQKPKRKKKKGKKQATADPPKTNPRRRIKLDLPPPAFLNHPVVMVDRGTGVVKYQNLGPIVHKFWASTVGEILSQRPLGANTWVIGCKSKQQQQKLARTTELAGVHVKCTIPDVKTVGVVKGIPPNTKAESLLPHIKNATKVQRINSRQGGKPTWLVRIEFSTPILPKTVQIGVQEYMVRPYEAPVLTCSTCARLGHTKYKCEKSTPTCRRCGQKNHRAEYCKAAKPHCINCGGGHSAAYQGCPEIEIRQRANTIKAETYIAYSEAIRRAKVQLKEEREAAQKKRVESSVQHDPYWRSETVPTPTPTLTPSPTTKRTYAYAVKARATGGTRTPHKQKTHEKEEATANSKKSTHTKPKSGTSTKSTKSTIETSKPPPTPQTKKRVQILKARSKQVLIRKNLEVKRIENIEKTITDKLSSQFAKQMEELTNKLNAAISTKVNEEVNKRLLKEEELKQIRNKVEHGGGSYRDNFLACTLIAISKARASGDPKELLNVISNALPDQGEPKQSNQSEPNGGLWLLAKYASDTPLSHEEWQTLRHKFNLLTYEEGPTDM